MPDNLLLSAPQIYLGMVDEKIIICDAVFSKLCQISTFYSTLYLILHCFKEEAEVRKQGLPFIPARSIRIVFFYGGIRGLKILRYIRILTLYLK